MSDFGDKTTRNEPDRAHGEAGSTAPQRDRPWLFRTYAGHSTAAASNELFRDNLSRGQIGRAHV
jgi:(2R)-ethylmalonyl-CoA mutase